MCQVKILVFVETWNSSCGKGVKISIELAPGLTSEVGQGQSQGKFFFVVGQTEITWEVKGRTADGQTGAKSGEVFFSIGRTKITWEVSTAVVERSNSSCKIRPWMRKVVGSNLGEDLYRNLVFLLWN